MNQKVAKSKSCIVVWDDNMGLCCPQRLVIGEHNTWHFESSVPDPATIFANAKQARTAIRRHLAYCRCSVDYEGTGEDASLYKIVSLEVAPQ